MLASNPIEEIAGRNSSADDEQGRDPPDAFFYLGSGPTDGRRYRPRPRVWFGFDFGFDFETTSDQKDSAMPSKTPYWAPSMTL